jgi:hypothetical protein
MPDCEQVGVYSPREEQPLREQGSGGVEGIIRAGFAALPFPLAAPDAVIGTAQKNTSLAFASEVLSTPQGFSNAYTSTRRRRAPRSKAPNPRRATLAGSGTAVYVNCIPDQSPSSPMLPQVPEITPEEFEVAVNSAV